MTASLGKAHDADAAEDSPAPGGGPNQFVSPSIANARRVGHATRGDASALPPAARYRRRRPWLAASFGILSAFIAVEWMACSPKLTQVRFVVSDGFRGVCALQYREKDKGDIHIQSRDVTIHISDAPRQVIRFSGIDPFAHAAIVANLSDGSQLPVATQELSSPWKLPNETAIAMWVTGYTAFTSRSGGDVRNVLFVIVGTNEDYRIAQSEIESWIDEMRNDRRFEEPIKK